MHDAILSKSQQSALALLSQQPAVASFDLAGGTALALQLGHRESLDFDFFRERGFDPQDLPHSLPHSRVLQAQRDTLTVELHRVKTSQSDWYHLLRCLTYFADAEAEPMPRLRPDVSWDEMKCFFANAAVHGRS